MREKKNSHKKYLSNLPPFVPLIVQLENYKNSQINHKLKGKKMWIAKQEKSINKFVSFTKMQRITQL